MPNLGQIITKQSQRGVDATLRPSRGQAARVFKLPVVGEDYVMIKDNERPGRANHAPQPRPPRMATSPP